MNQPETSLQSPDGKIGATIDVDGSAICLGVDKSGEPFIQVGFPKETRRIGLRHLIRELERLGAQL